MVLFTGFIGHPKGKESNKDKKQAVALHPIKSAVELLGLKDRQGFLQTVERLIRPPECGSDFFIPAMEKFAEFVQDLPDRHRGFFGESVEFLTQGLERASRTLVLGLAHFFPEKLDFSNISQRDLLWIYASFTAALLLDVGKVVVKYIVMLYPDKDHGARRWDPYTGGMWGQGRYYDFSYVKENLDALRCVLTPLTARQILDSATRSRTKGSGFNWIASDPEVLSAWLDMLSGAGDRLPMTSFMSLIPRADIEMIERLRREKQASVVHPAGEAFLQWIRKEIQEARIVANQDDRLRITEREVALSASLFREFAEKSPHYKHPETIEQQFIDTAQLYQIAVSDLDKRYRAQGGVSGLSDLGQRYRAIGGLGGVDSADRHPAPQRYLRGGAGLFALLTPQTFQQIMQKSSLERGVTRPPMSPSG